MNINPRKVSIIGVLLAFLANTFGPMPLAQAQDFRLPAPGVMVPLSPEFKPPILKGIKVHPDNPFRFDFILDKGESHLGNDQLRQESSRLIKYFLASLTIPEKDLWVNLSPYEKDRIVPESFGRTEMGRDLLAEDYMLKQITATLIYPEGETGKKFWQRIYAQAAKRFGTTNIPLNTFNKVWIVPEKAVVYENAKAGTAYVVESRLKVMLEEDYFSLQKHEGIQSGQAQAQNTNQLGSQIVREIVIPELTKEVNEDKNFSQLRQVYNSLILATWYKKRIKDSILEQVYADKNKVAGVNIDDPQEKEKIYQRYLQAFKKGVYNYIKEDVDPNTQETIPRKYFSGGWGATNLGKEIDIETIDDRAMLSILKKAVKNLLQMHVLINPFSEKIIQWDRLYYHEIGGNFIEQNPIEGLYKILNTKKISSVNGGGWLTFGERFQAFSREISSADPKRYLTIGIERGRWENNLKKEKLQYGETYYTGQDKDNGDIDITEALGSGKIIVISFLPLANPLIQKVKEEILKKGYPVRVVYQEPSQRFKENMENPIYIERMIVSLPAIELLPYRGKKDRAMKAAGDQAMTKILSPGSVEAIWRVPMGDREEELLNWPLHDINTLRGYLAAPQKILSVGSGTALVESMLALDGDFVVALDKSPQMIVKARALRQQFITGQFDDKNKIKRGNSYYVPLGMYDPYRHFSSEGGGPINWYEGPYKKEDLQAAAGRLFILPGQFESSIKDLHKVFGTFDTIIFPNNVARFISPLDLFEKCSQLLKLGGQLIINHDIERSRLIPGTVLLTRYKIAKIFNIFKAQQSAFFDLDKSERQGMVLPDKRLVTLEAVAEAAGFKLKRRWVGLHEASLYLVFEKHSEPKKNWKKDLFNNSRTMDAQEIGAVARRLAEFHIVVLQEALAGYPLGAKLITGEYMDNLNELKGKLRAAGSDTEKLIGILKEVKNLYPQMFIFGITYFNSLKNDLEKFAKDPKPAISMQASRELGDIYAHIGWYAFAAYYYKQVLHIALRNKEAKKITGELSSLAAASDQKWKAVAERDDFYRTIAEQKILDPETARLLDERIEFLQKQVFELSRFPANDGLWRFLKGWEISKFMHGNEQQRILQYVFLLEELDYYLSIHPKINDPWIQPSQPADLAMQSHAGHRAFATDVAMKSAEEKGARERAMMTNINAYRQIEKYLKSLKIRDDEVVHLLIEADTAAAGKDFLGIMIRERGIGPFSSTQIDLLSTDRMVSYDREKKEPVPNMFEFNSAYHYARLHGCRLIVITGIYAPKFVYGNIDAQASRNIRVKVIVNDKIVRKRALKRDGNLDLYQGYAKDRSPVEKNFRRIPYDLVVNNNIRIRERVPTQSSLSDAGKDKAMSSTGGIDLSPANNVLQTQNNGREIKFHMDPAMLAQLQNAPGFVPVIINIQPLKSLSVFLGIN